MNRRALLTSVVAMPAALHNQVGEAGFVSLFDGKTLRGWSVAEGPVSAFYVAEGAIVVHPSSNFPTWLRSEESYENFDFRGEFYIKGWIDSGIYIHAPEHGRNTWAGMQIKIFHQQDKDPTPQSSGSIFPLLAPLRVNVRNRGEWNDFRILMDWPLLRVWINGEKVQDLDVDKVPDLRYRLRRGFLGFASLSYPIRFRNVRIRTLLDKERWQTLYETEQDFGNWFVSEGNPKFEPLGPVLWADGVGHLATREKFRDFELQLYIRASRHHNSGILFRTTGQGLKSERHYEIQLHNVEEAHFPTGSLYHFKRAIYPRIEDEKWFLFQLVVEGANCLVRINGENVMQYDRLENLEEGHIELQAHHAGRWTEFKRIRIKRL